MTANQAVFPLQTMARVLAVSRSGFHAWSSRPASTRFRSDAILADRIAQIHRASRETYGARGFTLNSQTKGPGLAASGSSGS